MQEAVANMLKIAPEYAKGLFGLYKEYVKAGFTSKQAMQLICAFVSTMGGDK